VFEIRRDRREITTINCIKVDVSIAALDNHRSIEITGECCITSNSPGQRQPPGQLPPAVKVVSLRNGGET